MPLLERLKFLAIFASQSRRVLHGPRRRACSKRSRPASPLGSGPTACRRASSSNASAQTVREMVAEAVSRACTTKCCPRSRRKASSSAALEDLTDERAQAPARSVPPRDLPGADAAGHRPGPSVPAPAEQVAQPGRACCNGPGTPNSCSPSCRCPAVLPRFVPLPAERRGHVFIAAGNGDSPAPGGIVPRHGRSSTPPCSASRATANTRSTTTKSRTCSRRSRRRSASAAAARPCGWRSRPTPPAEVEQFLMNALDLDADRRLSACRDCST